MQVQARDTLQTFNEPPHYTYTQIRIQVIDVNDETPELKMVLNYNNNLSIYNNYHVLIICLLHVVASLEIF